MHVKNKTANAFLHKKTDSNTNFLSSLALDISSIVHLSQTVVCHGTNNFRQCPSQNRIRKMYCCLLCLPFLFYLLPVRRRKFLLWLGGFRIYERRVLGVRKANKSENNDARMKISKPYILSVKIW